MKEGVSWRDLGKESGGSLQSESEKEKTGRDSQCALGFLIGGRCNTCNESASLDAASL